MRSRPAQSRPTTEASTARSSPSRSARWTRRWSSSSSMASDEGPGVAASGRVDREAAARDEGGGAALDRLNLVVVEQRGDVEGDALGNFLRIGQQALRDGVASELPDHRAQLVVGGEAQTVVDGVHAPVQTEEAVTALAVGVVDQDVE